MQPNQPSQPLSQAPAKSIFASRTIAGIAIALLPLIARCFGVQLDDAAAQATADDLVTIAGAALAIYGRFKATQRVEITPSTPVLLALIAGFAMALLPGCTGLPQRTYSLTYGDGKTAVSASLTLGSTEGTAK